MSNSCTLIKYWNRELFRVIGKNNYKRILNARGTLLKRLMRLIINLKRMSI